MTQPLITKSELFHSAANAVKETVKEGAAKAGETVVNGAKVAVTAVQHGANAIQSRAFQDDALAGASDKINAVLNQAELTLKTDGYNTLNRIVDVSPLVKALESKKLEASPEDSNVKGKMKTAFNALLSYHQKTAIGGERAARKAFSLTYIATKYLLTPLTFIKGGKVLQEALSLGVAAIARAVTTVIAAIVFALPELVVLGGLATAGTFAGLGIAAGGAVAASTIGALKISGYVAAGLAGAGYIARNEIMHKQGQEKSDKILDGVESLAEGFAEKNGLEKMKEADAANARYAFNIPGQVYDYFFPATENVVNEETTTA